MERWSVLALAIAAAMIAGPASAQSTGSGAPPQTQQSPSQPAKPGDAGSPASPSMPASPSAPAGDASRTDGMKSDSSRASRAGRTGNREQVKAAQEALAQKGFDPGPADGMMGPKTQAALKEFQKAEKMNETGRLDAETMAKLGVHASAETASPAASPKTGNDRTSKDPTVPGPSEIRKKQSP